MQQTSKRSYTFGEFTLDLTAGCLFRNGTEVKLRPKAFEALLYLVENPNRLISKEELVGAVWTDAFVTDNSLVKCLKDVRTALDDQSHIIIKTVPRRGYVFAAAVNGVGSSAPNPGYREQIEGIKIVIEEEEQSESDQSAERALEINRSLPLVPAPRAPRGLPGLKKGLRSAVAGGVLALIVVATVSYYFVTGKPSSSKRSRPTISIENIKLSRLTTTGDVYAPAISPDGKYLAYCSGPKLCVQQIATGSTMKIDPPTEAHLSGTVRYWGIIFSADSSYIYFIIADDGENVAGTLFRVPVLGGRSQKLKNNVAGGGNESPDGQHFVFIRVDQNKGLGYLTISNTDGTNEQIISTIDRNSLFCSLDWSPDGGNILYAFRQGTPDGYIHYVAEIPATGGAESRLTLPRRERIVSARWLPDKSGLIMCAIDSVTHLPQLYYVAYPGGDERRITNDLNDYKDISLAGDGRTLVAQISNVTTQLWLAPKGDPGRAAPLASGTRGWFGGLDWMPDSEIVCNSEENGLMQICKMREDGSQSQQLTTGPGHNTDPSVTPDGRFIVFFSTRSGSGQIWRMTANGDDAVQLTHAIAGVFMPQTSADGEWVYYTADVNGKWQVWKVSIDGGEQTVVEDAPVALWAISPDGKMLAYSFFDDHRKRTRVAVRRLDAAEPFRYFDISPDIGLKWTKDGQALTYVEPVSGNRNIWIQPLDGKSARPLTELPAHEWIVTFAWSPDGKVLAYTRINTTFDAALLELN